MHPRSPRAKKVQQFDRYFFGIVLSVTIVGLLAFVSASLGIFAKSESKFYNVLFNQIVLGFVGGIALMWACMHIPYRFWKTHSFLFFILALGLTLAVFIPPLGLSHGGARRWLEIGPISFQPAELLKVAFIMYAAAWLSWARKKQGEFKYKVLPLAIILGAVAVALLPQPDTKSLMLIIIAAAMMLFVSGVSWKKIAVIMGIAAIGIAAIAFFRPYVMERVTTFLNPDADPRGASYQLNQSLIAVGSGGIFGRGLGQSIQKFNYLPEPQGDSIFSVIAEEFGFIGSSILVILYVFIGIRGYKIALQAPDAFGRYLVVGLITLIFAQSFLNIASLIGLFPLTGVPLVFISHGGTSLAAALAAAGIILNVSKHKKEALV